MNVQALMKDLRNLKQEELTLVNLSSKISDQLNRLKVEELALQNMVRIQNEELERKSRGSQRSINRSLPLEESDKGDNSDVDEMEANENSVESLQLNVNQFNLMHEYMEGEEEEEDEEEDERGDNDHNQIQDFIQELS